MSGRPNEGRVKLTCYVLPLTAERITFLVDKRNPESNTKGKVVDSQFGTSQCRVCGRVIGREPHNADGRCYACVEQELETVQSRANVAGAGRKAPRGQHGRAKRSSNRAKRANGLLSDRRGAQESGGGGGETLRLEAQKI